MVVAVARPPSVICKGDGDWASTMRANPYQRFVVRGAGARPLAPRPVASPTEEAYTKSPGDSLVGHGGPRPPSYGVVRLRPAGNLPPAQASLPNWQTRWKPF